jgi:hypothetical protein
MWYIITWLFLWGFCYLIYKGQKENLEKESRANEKIAYEKYKKCKR